LEIFFGLGVKDLQGVIIKLGFLLVVGGELNLFCFGFGLLIFLGFCMYILCLAVFFSTALVA